MPPDPTLWRTPTRALLGWQPPVSVDEALWRAASHFNTVVE